MAIERRLTELVGDAGGKAAHRAVAQRPGRHRRRAVHPRPRQATPTAELSRSSLRRSGGRRRGATATGRCPATRTSSARSRSTSSHHLLAYFWMLERDRQRRASPSDERRGRCRSARARWPARTSTPTARWSPRELGFEAVAPNSIDAVSNRDFVLDYLLAPQRPAPRTSRASARRSSSGAARSSASPSLERRLGQRLVMMPQKKNPDAAELLRGKAPRVVGHMTTLHGVMHGLPLTYNKDMQEDKEHLFDAVDTLELCLAPPPECSRRRPSTRPHGRRVGRPDDRGDDIADLLVQGRAVPRVPTASSPAWCATRWTTTVPCRPSPPRSCGPTASISTTAVAAVLQQSSWLETKVSRGRHVAGPRARAARRRARRPAVTLPAALGRPSPTRRLRCSATPVTVGDCRA